MSERSDTELKAMDAQPLLDRRLTLEQFRQLAEKLREVVYVADLRIPRTEYISPAYEQVWGRSCQSLYDDPFSFMEAVHPDDRHMIESSVRGVHQGGVLDREYRVVHPDGTIRWVHDRAFPVLDAEGRMLRVTGIAEDITQRKQTEDLACQQQLEIAHLSRVSSVGEMASGIAHELNQPLGAMVNYSNLCLELLAGGGERPDEQRAQLAEALRELAREAERASGILQRIRQFVRKKDAPRRVEDLNAIVCDSLELMGSELRRAGIRPTRDLARQLPPVRVDAVQVQQVVVNLLQNALDAMAALPPRQRRLLLRSAAADEGLVSVSVVDNGCGLAPGQQETIFNAFCTTKPLGLGLGLPISRSIVESHGGRLVARANAASGMTFEFTLPVAR